MESDTETGRTSSRFGQPGDSRLSWDCVRIRVPRAFALPAINRVLGGRHRIWGTPELIFWHGEMPASGNLNLSRIGGWGEIWEYAAVADILYESMVRLEDPERYDLDGLSHYVDDDLHARRELHTLHLADFRRRELTPLEIMAEVKHGMLTMEPGHITYYDSLRVEWIRRMQNSGWSLERLDRIAGRPGSMGRILAASANDEPELRAHARAARLRRVARAKAVYRRDGMWTEADYQRELDRVLVRAGLRRDDLPDDVAYLY